MRQRDADAVENHSVPVPETTPRPPDRIPCPADPDDGPAAMQSTASYSACSFLYYTRPREKCKRVIRSF